jgi:hypothetical protein
VCFCDAFDDRQTETDTGVVGMCAFGPAKERLAERGHDLWGELLAGVLDGKHGALGVDAGREPDGALFTQVVDDCVVNQVRTQLQQERVRSDGGTHIAGGFDRDAPFFRQGEKRFSGFLGYQGEVDAFSGEGSLVGATEQEHRFSEVDGSGVDSLEAVNELEGVTVLIVAGNFEQCLRDCQRGAQFV